MTSEIQYLTEDSDFKTKRNFLNKYNLDESSVTKGLACFIYQKLYKI